MTDSHFILGPFRQPKILEMCRTGDYRRFLCIMEVVPGEIVGGTFQIKAAEEYSSKAWARGLAHAWSQAMNRAESGAFLPGGSSYDDFERA